MPVLPTPVATLRLAALLALCLAALVLPVTTSHAAGGDGSAPPLKVTASGDTSPRYGDDVVVEVASTGVEVSASITWEGTEVAESKPLEGSSTTFTIPHEGRFVPGETYRFEVLASSEQSSGRTSFTFTPTKIPVSMKIANTTMSYRGPIFGVITPDAPTTVPLSGTVYMTRNGNLATLEKVRTDGTFALRDTIIPPGTYPAVEFEFSSPYFASLLTGSGGVVADITVVRVNTATTTGFSSTDVVAGQPLTLTSATVVTDPYTDAKAEGTTLIETAPVSDTSHFTEIARDASSGEPRSFDLTQWATTHVGDWQIRATFVPTDWSAGGPRANGSSVTTRLRVRAAGGQATTTDLTLDARRIVVGSAQLTGHVSVATEYGDAPVGEVRLGVDGVQRAVLSASKVRQRFSLGQLDVGTHTVAAAYLGGGGFKTSSTSTTIEVVRAATITTVQPPTGKVRAGDSVAFAVAGSNSQVVPTGVVRILENGNTVATAVLDPDGTGRFTVPALSAGAHRLQVTYAGDGNTEPSSAELPITMATTGVIHPAASVTRVVKVRRLAHRRVRLIAQVAGRVAATGRVTVLRGRSVVARGVLRAGRVTLTTKRLPRGRSTLVVRYAGSPTLLASSAKPVRVRLR